MSPVASYRRLFSLTGPLYVVVAFLGRLPLAMSQIGTLLLVAGVTGSYGAGGASAGAVAVANAIGSPLAGALTDRVGQRPVLLVQSLVSSGALVALVALSRTDVTWPVLAGVGAVSGLFTPQVGVMARVRWRPITRATGAQQRGLLDTAFSYEGAADEASFVMGPALVGLVAALLDPAAALLLAAGLLLVFATWFAVHATVALIGRPDHADGTVRGRLITGGLVILATAQLVVGLIFGSVQAGASVLATEAGEPGLTGLLHGLLGVGSVVAGLAVAGMPEAFRYESRLRVFASGLLVLSLPLLVVNSLLPLAGVLLVLGHSIAPYMITNFTLAERITAPARIAAAMTVLAATTGLGYALGSSIAGRLADWGGHTPALAVPVVAGALATTLALTSASRLRRYQALVE